LKLLSIHLPSNKPLHLRRLVENLVRTAADPTCFEVVVKIDIGDTAMEQAVAEIRRDIAVNLTVVVSERFPSYFHAYMGLNECLRASDPEYYFCWHINDEILIETPHWDTALARYVDFFPDGFFRLKVDRQKMFYNFFDIEETCGWADYPIVPRRWIDATEIWAPCHGAEVFQEGVALYLARAGYYRSIPFDELIVGGDIPGKNLSPEKELMRGQGIPLHWDLLMSVEVQEQMALAARRIQLRIIAHEHHLEEFDLREDPIRRMIALLLRGRVHLRLSYAIDHVRLRLRQFDHVARRNVPWSLWGKSRTYRRAVPIYRALRRGVTLVVALLEVPVGLAMGVPWAALVASARHPEWRSISQDEGDSWTGAVRRRVLRMLPRPAVPAMLDLLGRDLALARVARATLTWNRPVLVLRSGNMDRMRAFFDELARHPEIPAVHVLSHAHDEDAIRAMAPRDITFHPYPTPGRYWLGHVPPAMLERLRSEDFGMLTFLDPGAADDLLTEVHRLLTAIAEKQLTCFCNDGAFATVVSGHRLAPIAAATSGVPIHSGGA
jgi:hypothetical protein